MPMKTVNAGDVLAKRSFFSRGSGVGVLGAVRHL
jgi:hypothetical protein